MAVTISGYRVNEAIYESGNSLIFRGKRKADNQPVILKMLKQAYPSPEKIAWFKREYERTKNLNLTLEALPAPQGVVKAYSLETDQQRWVMALEDFGGESLARLGLAGQLPLAEFLSLANQIADIIGQVHQTWLMHKDINPSNIVLNPKTGQLKLIDFGISTMLTRENPTLSNPNVMEGTLAYISPEQTGRMNRSIDYRTDFYSLGVTFYELLTGQLPFATTDAMELVHSHIAKAPLPPHKIKSDLPQPLSDIVLKLMAKNAEDRYQSAYGLKVDLEECLRQWNSAGRIDPFALGQHDISDRFQIPQKLYGREQEIDLLLAAFERVSQGSSSELMLVSGYSGIGKSALVQEIYKPITRQRGYFIAGKFDQFQRDIPYASLVQAFRSLVRQLLTESESQIAAWREKLLAVLGPNGQVVIDVIPEVELIIGPQPEVPALSIAEAQNRFNLVFQNFIGVFTKAEHPLVLFLDDLQWADGASLKLLKLLITAPDSHYLFVIGAYRDNEVGHGHPLLVTLEEIRQAGVVVNDILLGPLSLLNLNRLIADALYCAPETAKPLADLVLAKTGGNPFFINEFLKSLAAEGLLTFLPPTATGQGGWRWDLAQIQAQNITDNVVELMAQRVQKLEDQTQQVLKLAACTGNQFDLQTLAVVYEKTPQETSEALWPAITEGLILPLDEAYKLIELEVEGLAEQLTVTYKFAHDRIQQAAYSLIPEMDKQAVHRQVGYLLLGNTPPDKHEEIIFDIVNQLNLGGEPQPQTERDELAELNLLAGKKAKAAAAYQPAFNYLKFGLGLLTPRFDARAGEPLPLNGQDTWGRRYDLTLTLHLETAEASYLSGNYEQMQQLTDTVLHNAKSPLDKVAAYDVRIQASTAKMQFFEALQAAREVLAVLGVEFPPEPTFNDVFALLGQTQAALAEKRIEELYDLPEMTDPLKLAAMRIMNSVNTAAYIAGPELYSLLVLKQLNLSLEYGNASESVFVYGSYGIILCGVVGDIDSGYQFGQLALRLMERFNAKEFTAKLCFIYNIIIRHWKEHLRVTAQGREGYQSGLETGDLVFGSYCTLLYCVGLYFMGRELATVEREMAAYTEAVAQLNQQITVNFLKIYRQSILNLINPTEHPGQLNGEVYNEDAMLPFMLEVNDRTALFYLYFNKMIPAFQFQDYRQALESAVQAEKFSDGVVGSLFIPVFYLHDSLIRLALFPEAEPSEQEQLLAKVTATQEKMKIWAGHGPMNYLHKYYLIEAERARVLGQDGEAREYYDKAIDLAQENGFLSEEALAYELAGKFYLAREQNRLAQHYLRDARYAYLRWGATAKVKDLETRYPQFLAQTDTRSRELPTSTTPTTDTGQTASTILDLASVLKASQAISGEIVLDRLLEKLMKIVIENAGAQRGYLILEEEGNWVIEAEAEAKAKAEAEVTALQALSVQTSERLPLAIINYVTRTKENVVLNDASREGLFTGDPYIRQSQPKSILCAPLINQGKLTGLLYLENNLTPGAFTPDRLKLLNILSAQAAISIENARLYTYQVQMTHAASRFVPYEFMQLLQKESIVRLNLGDQVQQNMTIMVSDIRSFTTLSETMTPQENFDFVNAYLSRVGPIIRQHNGFIAKYMGDGIMAVFPKRVEDAINAAIETLRQVAGYNIDRRQQGQQPIQIGAGIHTGPVMLGTVGEAQRMQLDLLSDAVNVTARLEGLTKLYGVPLVISTEVLQRLATPDQYQVRFLGKTPLKGRKELLPVFEVFDGDPAEISALKLETKADFEKGLSLYHDWQFPAAKTHFEQVLRQYPADKATQFYLQRMADFTQHSPPAEGVSAEAQADS